MTGFEPATSCSQNRSATKLRYIPDLCTFYTFRSFFANRGRAFLNECGANAAVIGERPLCGRILADLLALIREMAVTQLLSGQFLKR